MVAASGSAGGAIRTTPKRAQFERDGFYTFHNVLRPEMIVRLTEASDRTLAAQDAAHFEAEVAAVKKAPAEAVKTAAAEAAKKAELCRVLRRCVGGERRESTATADDRRVVLPPPAASGPGCDVYGCALLRQW